MNTMIAKILEKKYLCFEEACHLILAIDKEELNAVQLAGILLGIQQRGLSVEELSGFRTALLERTLPIQLDGSEAIDLCGTGGDGKSSFNISTASAFLMAAMGYKVIKHGNYGISSLCGSSDVLQALGYEFSTDNHVLEKQLKQHNICFLHAPLFHPVLKKVAVVRKDLGIRTFFNALGPLLNPVQPAYQVTGTYSLELAKIYQHLLRQERKAFKVVYSMDGYDECSLTDACKVFGKSSEYLLVAKNLGVENVDSKAIASGKSIADSAKILRELLQGRGTKEQQWVLAANTALALSCYHEHESLPALFEEALASLKSGIAARTFKL